MAEEAEQKDRRPLVERDSLQLGWAIQDLAEFEQTTWNGRNVVLSADFVTRLRRAAKLVVHAYETEVIVPSEPLREALGISKSDAVGVVERAEHLRDEHNTTLGELRGEVETVRKQRDAYKTAYSLLEVATDNATVDLADIELLGVGPDPLDHIQTSLETAHEEAVKLVPPFLS